MITSQKYEQSNQTILDSAVENLNLGSEYIINIRILNKILQGYCVNNHEVSNIRVATNNPNQCAEIFNEVVDVFQDNIYGIILDYDID